MLNSRTFAALYLFHFCVCCGSFLQVLVRVRPMSNSDATGHSSYGTCLRQDSAHTITWIGQPQTRFTFDHVAGEFITQVQIIHAIDDRLQNFVQDPSSCIVHASKIFYKMANLLHYVCDCKPS